MNWFARKHNLQKQGPRIFMLKKPLPKDLHHIFNIHSYFPRIPEYDIVLERLQVSAKGIAQGNGYLISSLFATAWLPSCI